MLCIAGSPQVRWLILLDFIGYFAVTIQQHPILRRSGRLEYHMYATPTCLPQYGALLNSYLLN